MNIPDLFLGEARERLLRAGSTQQEVTDCLVFLERFHRTAQVCLTEFFVRVKRHKGGKSLATALLLAKLYDHIVWSRSTPARYGDPDDTAVDDSPSFTVRWSDTDEGGAVTIYRARGIRSCIGAQNTAAFVKIYLALDMQFSNGLC